MKKPASSLLVLLIAIIAPIVFVSCQKDTSGNTDNTIPNGMNKVSVYLTDGPTDYQQVLIDIRGIYVKLDTCRRNNDDDHDHPGCNDDHDSTYHSCEIWDTLSINPGVYDLLTLRNGVDSLIAAGFVLNGKIERIKLILGTNNSVMVDSVMHPLNLVNNQNYVYIDIHRDHLDSLSSNNLQLYLDFDLQRSIRYLGGQYWLKPVLRPFGQHSTGEIEGKVRPNHSHGMIKAYNATDSAFALPWDDGEFKLRGLDAGTYTVFIDGTNGYSDSTINNVVVTRNHETNLGTIQLHQ